MASSPTPAHRASPVLIQPATFALRAAAQNASCALLNAPQARACTSAVAPGNAPGLYFSTSR